MQSYLNKLSEWVEAEAVEVGGYAELAHRISAVSGDRISSEAIRKWANKKVGRHGLQDDSLEKIAAYREMTKPQVREWLENDEAKAGLGESSLQWLKKAPIAIVAQALQICADRLNLSIALPVENVDAVKFDTTGNTIYTDAAMPYPTFAALIKAAFERKNWGVEQGIREFVALQPEEKVEYWRFVLMGIRPAREQDYGAMATVLTVLTGDEWTETMLKQKIAPWCISNKGLPNTMNESS